MSWHSHLDWTMDDGFSQEAVDALIGGLQCNREYNGDGKWVGVYGVWTSMDTLTLHIGHFLDAHHGEHTTADLERFVKGAPNDGVREIIRQVVAGLGEAAAQPAGAQPSGR